MSKVTFLTIDNQQVRRHDAGFSGGFFHTYDRFQTCGVEDAARMIQVFLPYDYESSNQRYPVVYMNDGNTAFFKGGLANETWGVGNTLSRLYQDYTIPKLIVVAIYPLDRNHEYTHAPWKTGEHWGGLDQYASMIANDLKPFIDAHYRSLPQRETTMIMGSSHGGLAAFYTANRWPNQFGFCAAMSPSFWVGVDDASNFDVIIPVEETSLRQSQLLELLGTTLANPRRRPKLYLDWGLVRTGGKHNQFIEERATERGREMVEVLQEDYGYKLGTDLFVYEDPQGEHNEITWGRHVPKVLKCFTTAI